MIRRANRAAFATMVAFLLPPLALAARLWPLGALADAPVRPILLFSACVATCFLLIVERSDSAVFFLIFILAPVPSFLCGAWLDGEDYWMTVHDIGAVAVSTLAAWACARLASGATAGLLWASIHFLPLLAWIILNLTHTREPVPAVATNILGLSPLGGAIDASAPILLASIGVSVLAFAAATLSMPGSRQRNSKLNDPEHDNVR
ncbi:MAG: hypothetical protein HY286_18610 [Planctomycetes bacterium]|nr:hypothetical protein [Planctomycetota bacterium]